MVGIKVEFWGLFRFLSGKRSSGKASRSFTAMVGDGSTVGLKFTSVSVAEVSSNRKSVSFVDAVGRTLSVLVTSGVVDWF